MKIKRPDSTFEITVTPVLRVHPCAARVEQESNGYFGFHPSGACSECKVTHYGYEFWGENGHRQGGASDRGGMCRWVARKVKEQWRARDGRLMGYRFRVGEPVRYLGAEAV